MEYIMTTRTETNAQEIQKEKVTWSHHIHQQHYETLIKWIRTPFATRKPLLAFLYGPPGVGKTTLAHRVISDAGLRHVECNASQFRNKSAMTNFIEPLFNSTNVTDYFRPEGPRAMGIVLDEIDGMSAGDHGGFTELVRILSSYRGPNAIICISNEWEENRYKPFHRMSLCCEIKAPVVSECAKWMNLSESQVLPVWYRYQGDLRKLQQAYAFTTTATTTATTTTAATATATAATTITAPPDNDIVRQGTAEELVLRLLSGELDIQDEHTLDRNGLNLAGLHLHETLPGWIRDNYDASAHGFRMYMDCLLTIATSDRQDYFTFFYQHWSLFPLSFQSKLQAVNYRLFVVERPKRWTSGSPKWKFEYTAVLKRQSWLFNQFKYTCEIRDLLQTYPDYRDGGIETAARVMAAGPELTESLGLAIGTKRTTHLLSKLAVPTVPPCPRGSSTRILKTQKK